MGGAELPVPALSSNVSFLNRIEAIVIKLFLKFIPRVEVSMTTMFLKSVFGEMVV